MVHKTFWEQRMNLLVPQPILVIAQLEVTKSISVIHPVSEIGTSRGAALLPYNVHWFLAHLVVLAGLLNTCWSQLFHDAASGTLSILLHPPCHSRPTTALGWIWVWCGRIHWVASLCQTAQSSLERTVQKCLVRILLAYILIVTSWNTHLINETRSRLCEAAI